MVDRDELRARLRPDMAKVTANWPKSARPDDAEKHEFAMRHCAAIQMLIEAEAYFCRDRVAVLFEAVEGLEPDALPDQFSYRHAVLEAKLRAKRNKGPRLPKRDDQIRFRFQFLRHEMALFPQPRMTREMALRVIGSEVGLSPSAIDTIVSQDAHFRAGRDMDPSRGFQRLQDYIEKRWHPRKP